MTIKDCTRVTRELSQTKLIEPARWLLQKLVDGRDAVYNSCLTVTLRQCSQMHNVNVLTIKKERVVAR